MKLVIVLLLAAAMAAQQPRPQAPGELTRQQLEQELNAYRLLLLDWAGLTRYGSDNAELKLKAGEQRVVFLGDDLSENWGAGKTPFFPGKPYLNRGITRQTSAQMLVRFRQDVIALKPAVVVIQAGSNDLASVMGPTTPATMEDNFQSMIDLAKLNKIRVVLAAVPPVCDCGKPQTLRRPPGKIMGLNGWMKEFAEKSGVVFADIHAPLAQGRLMNPALTIDGLLLNDAGYAKIAPVIEQAIAAALDPARP